MLKRVKDIKKVLETFKNTKPFYLKNSFKTFSQNPEIAERLSNVDEELKQKYKWLGDEESMRKHLNILDWDEVEKKEKFERLKAIDLKIYKPFEKKELDEEDLEKITNEFRQKIFNLNQKTQGKMNKKKEDDYDVPEEVLNFERDVDMNKFREETLNKNFKDTPKPNNQEYDYLKDKPKNYLLVGNIKPETKIDELIIIIQSIGQVVKYNIIKDLSNKPSLIEVYYYTEKDAHKAKVTLDGYKFDNFFLTAKNFKDYETENINNRTLIVGNLPADLVSSDLVEIFSKFGGVMKVELPMEEVKAKNKRIYEDLISNRSHEERNLDTIFKYTDEYLNEFVENNYENRKQKLTLIYQFQKVKEILNKIGTLNNQEMRKNEFYELKNLYTELKFHITKLFPKHIVNSLIYNEIIKDSDNADMLDGLSELNKSKISQTFDKIFQNMSALVHKYDNKIKSLAEELTEDMIPIDPHESEYKDLDQERLQTRFTKKAEDEKDKKKVVKNDLRQMNFYSLNIPLNKQIDKIKLYRSLTQEERKHVKEKYNIDFKVNTVQFIDYFLQFSRNLGMEIFDKQIELANLYLSMSPIQRQYVGRKLAKNPRSMANYDGDLFGFLGLKKRGYINRPYDNVNLLNSVSELDKNVSIRLQTLAYNSKRRQNTLNFLVTEQLNFEKHIRHKYNEYWTKFIRDKRMISIFVIRLSALQDEVKSIINKIYDAGDLYVNKYLDRALELSFPTVTDYYEKRSKAFMFKNIEKDQMTEESKNLDKKIKENFMTELKKEYEKIDDKGYHNQDVKKVMKLDPQLDFDIKNSLDDLEHYQGKLLDKVLSLNKFILPKNCYFDVLKEHMKSKLTEYANSYFFYDETKKGEALGKLEDSMRFLKYVDTNFEEKEFKLWNLVEDLVSTEMEYLDKTRNIKRFFKELEEIFIGPVDKDSLAKVLGTYEIIHQVDKEGGNFELKNSFHRYFQIVQEMFMSELDKIDEIKEEKLMVQEEINMDDIFNQRKELIENYVNKVMALEEFKKLKPTLEEKTKEELDSYKISQMGKDNIFLESDSDGEIELLKNEIRKKKFETQGRQDTSYSNVDDILSNFNLERGGSNNVEGELKAKLDKIKNKKKLFNKGYAFVTFANSDQAKRLFLIGSRLEVEGNNLKLLPKLTATHEDFDYKYLKNKGSTNEHIIRKKHEIEEARNKLNEFERQFKGKLDENDEDYKNVIDGYKDIFSDPFKRHDKEYNPIDSDEEAEIRNNIHKQEKESKMNHLWLYEDDKLDELRKIKDKKITNKYIEWQLLKRGVVPEKKKNQESKKGFTFYNDILEDMIAEEPQISLESENKDLSGRNNSNKFGPSEFIEKYLGKDMLEVPAFRKNKKVSQFFQPVKELSERFPKEKFIETTKDYDKVVHEISKDYVKFLNDYDTKDDSMLNPEGKLLNKLSPSTPVNVLMAPVLEERKNFIQENRDNITYQTFLQRAAGDNFFRTEDLTQDYVDDSKLVDDDPIENYNEMYNTPNSPEMTPEELIDAKSLIHDQKKIMVKDYIIKERQKDKEFFNYLKENNYDISRNPKRLDILPLGFKARMKKKVDNDIEKTLGMDNVESLLQEFQHENLNEKEDDEEDTRKKTSKKKNRKYEVNSDEDMNQFDENILKADKIRELKNRKNNIGKSRNDEIMKSVLNKFNSLNDFDIPNDNNETDTLNRFESFIKETNSSFLASREDELTRQNKKNSNQNYEKFQKDDSLNSGVYGFQKENKKSEKDKEEEIEKLREKVKLEKEKIDFLKDLSTNFKEELETSQDFKEFFENLKNDKKYMNHEKNHDLQVDPLTGDKISPMQEVISSMHSNTFDKEMYKKHYMNKKSEEDIIKEWIKPEEIDIWNKQGRELQGITKENEKEMYDKIKLEYPLIVDENAIKFSENLGENFDTLLSNMIESNDLFEEEYYFNPESHQTIEQHLAGLSKFPNLKITVKKDQKGRYLIKREHKINYKYDLDEIMNFDLQKEREKLTNSLEEFDFSRLVVNEIEYKYQLQNLIEKHLRFKYNTDIEKIKENMKQLTEKELEAFSKVISQIITEGDNNELKEDQKYEIVNNIVQCFKQGKVIEPNQDKFPVFVKDTNVFYKTIRKNLNQNLSEKIYKDVSNSVRGELESIIKERVNAYFGKKIPLNSLRQSVLKIISLNANEINLLLNCFIKIMSQHEDIPIVKTSLDDISISIMLNLIQKSNKNFDNYNITDNNKFMFIQTDLLSSLLNSLTEGFNPVEKIMTYGIFNLLPEDVEFNNPEENYLDKSKYYASMWNTFKNSVIKNNVLTLIQQTNQTRFLKEHEFIMNKEILNSSRTEEGIKKEINEYSAKIKNFYQDFIRINPSELDYENFISDIEIFSNEISEQISNKLYRKKYLSKWSQRDFVEERINEETLYETQLKQTEKLLENNKVNNYVNDEELLKNIQENIIKLKSKKRRLLKEQRPIMDDDYVRIL